MNYRNQNGDEELYHYGVKGQKWGDRRYQYKDMSLTPEGRVHYNVGPPRGSGKSGATGGSSNVKLKKKSSASNVTTSKTRVKGNPILEMERERLEKDKAKQEKKRLENYKPGLLSYEKEIEFTNNLAKQEEAVKKAIADYKEKMAPIKGAFDKFKADVNAQKDKLKEAADKEIQKRKEAQQKREEEERREEEKIEAELNRRENNAEYNRRNNKEFAEEMDSNELRERAERVRAETEFKRSLSERERVEEMLKKTPDTLLNKPIDKMTTEELRSQAEWYRNKALLEEAKRPTVNPSNKKSTKSLDQMTTDELIAQARWNEAKQAALRAQNPTKYMMKDLVSNTARTFANTAAQTVGQEAGRQAVSYLFGKLDKGDPALRQINTEINKITSQVNYNTALSNLYKSMGDTRINQEYASGLRDNSAGNGKNNGGKGQNKSNSQNQNGGNSQQNSQGQPQQQAQPQQNTPKAASTSQTGAEKIAAFFKGGKNKTVNHSDDEFEKRIWPISGSLEDRVDLFE